MTALATISTAEPVDTPEKTDVSAKTLGGNPFDYDHREMEPRTGAKTFMWLIVGVPAGICAWRGILGLLGLWPFN